MSIEKIQMKILQPAAVSMLRVELPKPMIDEVNKYIDETVIPENIDHSSNLVGQINRNKRSSQLKFNFDKSDTSKMFKNTLSGIGTQFLQNAYQRPSRAEAYEGWTIHSYEGDYNPLHSHGVQTTAGLSCIVYLKVPKQITELPEPIGGSLNHASGATDGMTAFHWGHTSGKDHYELKHPTTAMIKPIEGLMILFPNWLNHCVNPFFGEGERRTFSANFNIYDNEGNE